MSSSGWRGNAGCPRQWTKQMVSFRVPAKRRQAEAGVGPSKLPTDQGRRREARRCGTPAAQPSEAGARCRQKPDTSSDGPRSPRTALADPGEIPATDASAVTQVPRAAGRGELPAVRRHNRAGRRSPIKRQMVRICLFSAPVAARQ